MAVTLGSFAFQDMEIPERINFSGPHLLARHQLIGGGRVFDAMGDDPAPIEWSGYLLGRNASDRARELDAMKASGGSFQLTWGSFARRVVIKTFDPIYGFEYRVSYRICVEVIPSQAGGGLSLDAIISGDFGTLSGLAIGGPIGAAVSVAQTAVAAAAATSGSNRLYGAPIYAIQTAGQAVEMAADNAMGWRDAADDAFGDTPLDAIPGGSPADVGAALLVMSDAGAALSDAVTAGAYLTRIAGNLALIGG